MNQNNSNNICLLIPQICKNFEDVTRMRFKTKQSNISQPITTVCFRLTRLEYFVQQFPYCFRNGFGRALWAPSVLG